MRRALVVEQPQHPHRQRRHGRHAAQQTGFRSAEAVGSRARDDKGRPRRVLERHTGRRASPDARHGERSAGAACRHGDELGGGRGALGVPHGGHDLAATDDRSDLRVECLRRPLDSCERRRGFRLG